MRHLYTSTPTKQSTYPPNVPFIDPMVDSVYSKMYWENNPLKLYHPEMQSTTIGNANNILYGMDNYLNDVPHQGFYSTEECNIGINMKKWYQ